MTKREFIEMAMQFEGATEEFKAKGAEMLKGLEKRNTKPTKAQIANEGIKDEIKAVLGAEGKSAKDIADEVGHSTAKVAALLKQIEGVVKTEGKGKNPATYTLAE